MNKFLVIGLGSMGKRRVRCLLSLGILADDIIGFDIREDRRKEAKNTYGIQVVNNEDDVNYEEIKAIVVSLPPDKHLLGVRVAIKHSKPVFVEASVVLDDACSIEKENKDNIFIAPSCTLTYHPIIKKIKEIVSSGEYGKVCDFTYHSGQYLPDWHPWENVTDFYVSNRITGGAREIVPFELTWIVDILGMPQDIKGYYRKTCDIGCDIEDSYVCVLDYGDIVGSLTVDVVGRFAARNLIINLEKAQIQWRWDMKKLEIYEADKREWKIVEEHEQIHQKGYNDNINENMYIEELGDFIKGIEDRSIYTNTMPKDIEVLKLLNKVEESANEA